MERCNINILLPITVLIAALMGCSTFVGSKPAAEQAVGEFHAKFNDWKFDEIYAGSDKRFKDAASEEEMDKLLTAVHTKLGLVKRTANQTWRANFNLVSTMVMVQDTEFEKGSGTETFTFVIEGNKAILVGYNINSLDMMTY